VGGGGDAGNGGEFRGDERRARHYSPRPQKCPPQNAPETLRTRRLLIEPFIVRALYSLSRLLVGPFIVVAVHCPIT